MPADAATAAFFALVLLPLVIAEATVAAVFTHTHPPLMFADTAASTFLTRAPL